MAKLKSVKAETEDGGPKLRTVKVASGATGVRGCTGRPPGFTIRVNREAKEIPDRQMVASGIS